MARRTLAAGFADACIEKAAAKSAPAVKKTPRSLRLIDTRFSQLQKWGSILLGTRRIRPGLSQKLASWKMLGKRRLKLAKTNQRQSAKSASNFSSCPSCLRGEYFY